MSTLSDARIEAIALQVLDTIDQDPSLRVLDRGTAAKAVVARLRSVFHRSDDLDAAVRAKIASLSRSVPEGSREWEILYRQYTEELRRKG